MSIQLYMDHHIPRAITQGLRARGVDVLTAYDDGADRMPDPDVLDRAGQTGRVLVTQDQDFLHETARRLSVGIPFRGVIGIRQAQIHIGACVHDLERIARVYDPEDLFNRVVFLPL